MANKPCARARPSAPITAKRIRPCRRRIKREFVAKCGDSLRELEETGYWLELLVDAGIVGAKKLAPLRHECDELTAIFVTIIKKSRFTS